jgi:hypothetical protein
MVEWRPDWYENAAGSKLNSLVIRELAVHLCDNRRRWGFQDGQSRIQLNVRITRSKEAKNR